MNAPEYSERNTESNPTLNGRLWTAGARYANGIEIWCAYSNGESAWTTDHRQAAKFSSESDAAMAARYLTEGNAVPFWLEDDRSADVRSSLEKHESRDAFTQ